MNEEPWDELRNAWEELKWDFEDEIVAPLVRGLAKAIRALTKAIAWARGKK
jgi:hypothetical protein